MKLSELKDNFAKMELPKELQLNNYIFIKDVRTMVENHILTLERNQGNHTFMPYYNRLVELYHKLKK